MEKNEFIHLQGRINDLERLLVNLVHPIQQINELFRDNQRVGHLMHMLSRPLTVDDRRFQSGIEQLKMIAGSIEKSAESVDINQTLAEIKYIGNRLQGIEQDIRRIRIDGIRKNVCVEVTLDGQELEKATEKKKVVKPVKRKRGRPRLLK